MKKIFTKVINSNALGKAGNNLSAVMRTNFCFFCMLITLTATAAPLNNTSTLTVSNVTKKSYNGSDVSCSSAADAQLTVTASGGTGRYQYSIDNGATYQSGNVFSSLSGGRNYVVKVKDANNNTSEAVWVWVNAAPNPVTISGINKTYRYNGNNDVSCSSGSDGEITVSAWGGSGTLQYSKDNGSTYQSSNIFSGLAAGTYQVRAKDANGCVSAPFAVTLVAPAAVGGTIIAQTNVSCANSNTGSVTVIGTGGVGNYYYSMDGGDFQWLGIFINLAAGTHQLVVKDNNGCIGSVPVNITSTLNAVISGNAVLLSGLPATLNITISGTVGTKYTAVYKDNNGNNSTVSNLITGVNIINLGVLSASKSYTLVSLTSNGGCTGTVSGTAAVTIFSNCQWLGLNSNWNNVANWLNGILPASGYDVVIPATANNPVISQADVTVKNITLAAGTTITVSGKTLKIGGTLQADAGAVIADKGTIEYTGSAAQAIAAHTFKNNALSNLIISNTSSAGVVLGGNLDIYGSLTYTGSGKTFVTNDYLTLKSNAGGTARVGDMTGNSITGKVTVERFIPGVKRAWRFLAVPVMDGQSIHEAWQENQAANNTSLAGNGMQISSNVSGWDAKGFDFYTSTPSLKTYNSANDSWVGVNSTLEPISGSTGGYMAFVRGDRRANSGSSPVTSTVLRTKGQLYTGDQPTINVPAKHFVAVSNPYASPLDIRKIDNPNNLFFYVWDPNLASSSGYGAYQTLVKNASGNYVAIPGGGSYSATDNNLIQSGSAFFVYNNNGGSLTIKESSKAGENTTTTAFRGSAPAEQNLAIRLYGIDGGGTASLVDGVLQSFDETYTNDVDEMDAKKSTNTSETFSIRTQGQLLAVERKRTMVQSDTTFLHLTTVKVQGYRLEVNAENLTGVTGFLEDNYLQTKTPLNTTGITTYDFDIVNLPGSYAADRFSIVFKPVAVLPVTFTSVSATQNGNNVAVEWKVENEINMKQYEVEKSTDGNNFLKVATVAANNRSSESFTWEDEAVVAGNNYYRIRSLDANGKTEYTKVVKVQMGTTVMHDISVFPNPISNGTINLQLTNQAAGNYRVRIINQSGQQVLVKQISLNGGNSTKTFHLDKSVARGFYQVEVVSPGGNTKTIRIIY